MTVWANRSGVLVPVGTPPTSGGGGGGGGTTWRPRFAGDLPPGQRYVGNSLGAGVPQSAVESRMGRSAAQREYFQGTASSLTDQRNFIKAMHLAGYLPVTSNKVPKVRSGSTIAEDWKAVGDGLQDAWLRTLRDGIITAAGASGKRYPVWTSFNHEPRGDAANLNGASQTAAQQMALFRAMYERAIMIFDERPEFWRIAAFAPILNGYSFLPGGRRQDGDPKGWVCQTILDRKMPVWYDHYEQWWTYDKTLKYNFEAEADTFRGYSGAGESVDIAREINSWGCPSGLFEWGVHHQWLSPDVAGKCIDDLTRLVFDAPDRPDMQAILCFQSRANSPRGGWIFWEWAKPEADPARPGYPIGAATATSPSNPTYYPEPDIPGNRIRAAARLWARTAFMSEITA